MCPLGSSTNRPVFGFPPGFLNEIMTIIIYYYIIIAHTLRLFWQFFRMCNTRLKTTEYSPVAPERPEPQSYAPLKREDHK
eukprot:COSAG01_NODE_4063_length_5387_cov_5.413389_6_plen_80_part_00